MFINIPGLVKKVVLHVYAFILIGVTVWYQPDRIIIPKPLPFINEISNGHHNQNTFIKSPSIQVMDAKGNPFQMRQLTDGQYPTVVNDMMPMAEILICREYTFGTEKWYEWCTEESGEWVLYRWERGQTTLRRII